MNLCGAVNAGEEKEGGFVGPYFTVDNVTGGGRRVSVVGGNRQMPC